MGNTTVESTGTMALLVNIDALAEFGTDKTNHTEWVDLAHKLLEAAGVEVVSVENLEEVRERVVNFPPHINRMFVIFFTWHLKESAKEIAKLLEDTTKAKENIGGRVCVRTGPSSSVRGTDVHEGLLFVDNRVFRRGSLWRVLSSDSR